MTSDRSTIRSLRSVRALLVWLSIGLLLLAGCAKAPPAASQPATPVMVFAAASATEAIEEMVGRFEETDKAPAQTNFAGSSTLAQQIIAGAPADLFLSASESWADAVEKKGLVLRRRDLLSNRLVMVAPAASTLDLKSIGDLASEKVTRIALADEAVPAGQYARQALASAKLWDAIRQKVVAGADVRQALLLVEQNEADAGIVYATDARGRDRVRVVAEIDDALHEPIRYPLLLIKQTPQNPAAERLFDLACGPLGAKIFREHGFVVLDSSAGDSP